MFPRDRVIASLAKYKIDYNESMTDEELRDRLANFYAQRTLLKQPVTPAKVADGAYLLASDRLSQTTGQVLAVDAGLTDAFLR
jgi:enoyl-[acyl-carrier-protein] reductase (NADH)